MNRLEADAHDALMGFEARQKRHAAGYSPRPRSAPASTWASTMTEQQKREQEQHIKDHNLPF